MSKIKQKSGEVVVKSRLKQRVIATGGWVGTLTKSQCPHMKFFFFNFISIEMPVSITWSRQTFLIDCQGYQRKRVHFIWPSIRMRFVDFRTKKKNFFFIFISSKTFFLTFPLVAVDFSCLHERLKVAQPRRKTTERQIYFGVGANHSFSVAISDFPPIFSLHGYASACRCFKNLWKFIIISSLPTARWYIGLA